MSKAIRFVVVQLLMLAVLGAGAQGVGARGEHGEATVVRVIDGDTADVRFSDDGSTDRVRLVGIDTPDVVETRKRVQRFGREASEHVEDLA